jgi:outer membrane biosynthesis protein TonB
MGQGSTANREANPASVPTVSIDKKPFKIVQPIYPEAAKVAGVHGPVVVDIVIGKNGAVERAQPISGPKSLGPQQPKQ